jgi:hypothetical protein
MIITKIIGGLGNQMFQYATGKALAIHLNTQHKLDISAFNNYTLHKYCLNKLNIEDEIATDIETRKFVHKSIFGKILRKLNISKYKYYAEKKFSYDKALFNTAVNTYIDGYWQTEKYFISIRNILLKEFTPKNEPNDINRNILNEITNTDSVSIHIRRGDYISNPLVNQIHGVCNTQYYYLAIDLLKSKIPNLKLFVFSDDPKWVSQNFKPSISFSLIDNNDADNNHEDLRLMYNCKHNIIANSTFSWWAAWLNQNPDKIVIAPSKWFNSSDRDTSDILPANWTKI